MENNILKTEGIEIQIEEVNGLRTINIIQADNCNIKFKGNIILEDTKEEFSAIPIQIRKQLKSYANFIEEKDGVTSFDIDTSANYCCAIKTILTDMSKEELRLNNWLMSPEKINDCVDIDIEKYNNKIVELQDKAKEMGYRFIFSHDGDEYDDCYSLYVPVQGLDMNKVEEFLKLWEDFNEELGKMLD